ncbi:MAG: AAA family ATPase [Segniliparus sp.]|uniref:AAA family ATPase n=1 Tax=Segniliparus sp. TaxID=2804064 RepID=UPI003F346A95
MTSAPQLRLIARLNPSAADSRRGVVRLHAEVLAALGLREWDAVELLGTRTTVAVAGLSPSGFPAGVALLDDVTFSNTGLRENGEVVVSQTSVVGARSARLSGSVLAKASITPSALRLALLGKVLSVGDAVSLLPRDLGPGTSTAPAVESLTRSVGITWTSELLTVVATDPAGPVSVQPNSAVGFEDAHAPEPVRDAPPQTPAHASAQTAPQPSEPQRGAGQTTRDPAELVGVGQQVAALREWLALALDQPELLRALGVEPRLGALVTGPGGVGKATFVRSVVQGRPLVELDGPGTGSLESNARRQAVRAAADEAVRRRAVLLVTDVDALLPATPEPVATAVLDELGRVVESPGCALVATTAHPEGADRRLRDPGLCDRVLALPSPNGQVREDLLRVLLRTAPTGELDLREIALGAPGFVAADLAALVREAALRAAARASQSNEPPVIAQEDVQGALSVIRPLSRSGSEELSIGRLTLDDVGDMVKTKQALTETVLWPLRHPDTFARLGVEPPRGVLLYGPPGCGKTFLVRALAGSGQLSVHAVKGAELMDKWVGSSEKAVRELFARARDSAPSLVFLDEIDALAPRRGQSADSGVADRVVAALLTELDGVEQLRDVSVLGATNRPDLVDPALLRPGRLERLIYVPPPDAEAREAILRAAARGVPLAGDVVLAELAEQLDGYSAADCAAVLREAALTAMRRDIEATDITRADVEAALRATPGSLDPVQAAHLAAYAEQRQS